MSKALSKLLGQPEHTLAVFIGKLEHLSGLASEDIRLLNETQHATMNKNVSLGLDPKDTNGRELYFASQLRWAKDCVNFEKAIGVGKKESIDKTLSRLVKLAQHSGAQREVWTLKHSVAKELLRTHPPKSLLRLLHYRSIDSLLKHEDIARLYGALSFATSSRWQKTFCKTLAKLSPLDFETRPLEVISLPAKRWQGVLPNVPTVNSVSELGAVVLWPTKASEHLDALSLLAIILKAVENIQLVSAITKAQQGRGDYGLAVTKIWQGELPHLANLAGYSLSWQSFLHHLGRQPDWVHPVEFEPYVSPQDLHWQDVNASLSALHPNLAWWRDSTYLLHKAGGVSLNAVDTALNHIRKAEFGQRSFSAGRQALWDELLNRYLQHPAVFRYITNQLEQNLVPAAVRVTSEEINLPVLNSQVQPA